MDRLLHWSTPDRFTSTTRWSDHTGKGRIEVKDGVVRLHGRGTQEEIHGVTAVALDADRPTVPVLRILLSILLGFAIIAAFAWWDPALLVSIAVGLMLVALFAILQARSVQWIRIDGQDEAGNPKTCYVSRFSVRGIWGGGTAHLASLLQQATGATDPTITGNRLPAPALSDTKVDATDHIRIDD